VFPKHELAVRLFSVAVWLLGAGPQCELWILYEYRTRARLTFLLWTAQQAVLSHS
jgi:hypothetical protein